MSSANTSLTIPPESFIENVKYTFIVTISVFNWTSNATVSLSHLSYQTITLPEFDSTILSWWQDPGRIIGCISCPNQATSTTTGLKCSSCMTGMKLHGGECSCQQDTQYLDLSDASRPVCREKIASTISWLNLKTSPTFQFAVSFSDGLEQVSQILSYIAKKIGVYFSDQSLKLLNFSATVQNQFILLEFTIGGEIETEVTISVNKTFIADFNKLRFSPYYLEQGSLDYKFLIKKTTIDNNTKEAISKASDITSGAMAFQTATSSILPILVGGAATTAIFLVDFVGDVYGYKFINVPFPENFMLFCALLDSNLLPNPYGRFSNDKGVKNSNIGKFKEFDFSTVMLENSAEDLDRELFALALVIVLYVLLIVFGKNERVANKIRKFYNIFHWKTFLSFYIADFPDILLSSLVQAKENTSYGGYSSYSLIVSYTIILSSPVFLFLFVYYLNRKSYRRNQIADETELESQAHASNQSRWAEIPESISLITEDFNQNCRFNRNFMLVMIIENVLVDFLLVFLQDYGLVQAILYTLIVTCYIGLAVKYRPFKQGFQRTIFFINQSCKFIMGIFAILYGIHGVNGFLDSNSQNWIGYTLMGLILTAIAANAIIAIAVTLREIATWCKEKKQKQKVTNEKSVEDKGLKGNVNESSLASPLGSPLTARETGRGNLLPEKDQSSSAYPDNPLENEVKIPNNYANDPEGWFASFKRKVIQMNNESPLNNGRPLTMRNRTRSIPRPTHINICEESSPSCGNTSNYYLRTPNSSGIRARLKLLDFEMENMKQRGTPNNRGSLEFLEQPLSESKVLPSINLQQEPMSVGNLFRNPSIHQGLEEKPSKSLGKIVVLDMVGSTQRSSVLLEPRSAELTMRKSIFSLTSHREKLTQSDKDFEFAGGGSDQNIKPENPSILLQPKSPRIQGTEKSEEDEQAINSTPIIKSVVNQGVLNLEE